jgi:co-chaperonin GroES (HSP10)
MENKFKKLNIIKTEQSGISINSLAKLNLAKQGVSTIDWMPHGRNIVVIDDEFNNKEVKRMASIGLIDPNSLSDAERLALGGISKSAELANTDSENQRPYIIVAIGSEVTGVEVGDSVLFRAGCQGTSIKIKDKYYLQLGEFEVLGKFL